MMNLDWKKWGLKVFKYQMFRPQVCSIIDMTQIRGYQKGLDHRPQKVTIDAGVGFLGDFDVNDSTEDWRRHPSADFKLRKRVTNRSINHKIEGSLPPFLNRFRWDLLLLNVEICGMNTSPISNVMIAMLSNENNLPFSQYE